MSKYTNILITMMCINIMLVLGGVVSIDSDITEGNFLGSFFTFPNNDASQGASINKDFQGKLSNIPAQGGGSTTGLGFIDGIKMLLDLFSFLLVSMSAPLQLIFNPNITLPWVFRLLIGIPLSTIYIFSLVGWLRGNE